MRMPTRFLCDPRLRMALALLGLAAACNQAGAVVTVTTGFTGTRTITLRVGALAGVDTVQFNVVGPSTGNSLPTAAPIHGNGTAIAASSGGVVFRMYMQVPAGNVPQPMTTTVTSPATLTCAGGNCTGYAIPFSSISWTVSPAPSGTYAAFDLQNGTFNNGGGTQTLLSFSLTGAAGAVEVASTMNFTYANTVAYPAGTYIGTVTYTASLP
mgnify:CR=1 FL=1